MEKFVIDDSLQPIDVGSQPINNNPVSPILDLRESQFERVGNSRGNRTGDDGIAVDSGTNMGDRGVDTGSDIDVDNQGSYRGTDGTDSDRGTPVDNFLQPWTPDSTLSPEENLSSLTTWLNQLFSSSTASMAGVASPASYVNTLNQAYFALGRLLKTGWNKESILTLAEKVSDWSYQLISSQFSNAMAYQSWYLQQEYNSPVNQIKRLGDAGLHSAFAIGNVNSGNASSGAAVSSVSSSPSPSGSGNVETQKENNQNNLLASIFGSVSQFIPAFGGAIGSVVKDVVNAQVAKTLLPSQLGKMNTDIAVNQSNVLRQQAEIDSINSSTAIGFLDSEFKYSQQELQNAQSEVQENERNFKTLWDSYTGEYTEMAWETIVVDKNGNRKHYTLTTDALKRAVKNGGRVDSEHYILNSDSWSDSVMGKATIELGKKNSKSNGSNSSTSGTSSSGTGNGQKLGNEYMSDSESSFENSSNSAVEGLSSNLYDYLGIQGSTTVQNEFTKNKGSEEKIGSSTSQVFDDSRENENSEIGYNEDGSQFHIGNSVFYSVQQRVRLPLPEYKDRLKKSLQYWQDSLDRYNALTASQKRRLLYLEDNITSNFKNFSQGLVHAKYSQLIDSLFKRSEIPQEYKIGD